MTELRWILLVVGACVVAGVYFMSRRATHAQPSVDRDRVAPTLDADDEADTIAYSAGDAEADLVADDVTMPIRAQAAPGREPASGDQLSIPMPDDDDDDAASEADVGPDRVIRLHVVARDDAPFIAADIVGALRAEGLRFAHHDVFHRFDTEGNPGPDEPPLYSVADMLKPGTFDLSTLADKRLKGVSLFMALPNAGDPVAVFADMLATGRRLAATFSGLLVDEQGCAISRQSASHMREDIINYQLEARRQDDQAQ